MCYHEVIIMATKIHNDIEYDLFPTSIDGKGGRKQIGIAALPKFDDTLEAIAALVAEGWITEKSVAVLLRGQWAVRQRAVVKSAATGKASYTVQAMNEAFAMLSPEEIAEHMEKGDCAEYMKQVWKDAQNTEADPYKVFYASKEGSVSVPEINGFKDDDSVIEQELAEADEEKEEAVPND